MQLSRTERWILANQYRILEALSADKRQAQAYADAREALEWGFELVCNLLAEPSLEETLSREECAEIRNILTMYGTLQEARDVFPDIHLLDPHQLVFPGLDANIETRQWCYAQYCRDRLGMRLETLVKEMSSASPMLGAYRKMLPEWKKVDAGKLTREDVARIVTAGFGRL